MTFEFGIADETYDPAIRRLLADNPMPGGVTVAFEREPDYFLGHGVMGERCVTITAVEKKTRKLAAVMCIAFAERYVSGRTKPIGYIGQLRIGSQYRGYMIPLRAAPFVRSIVKADWPEIWFTVLADENPEALGIFAKRSRQSLPDMEFVARIRTIGILASPRHERAGARDAAVRSGRDVGLEPIARFLRDIGPGREFYPVYREEHFRGDLRTPGFAIDDFLVCYAGDEIVGVCGVWDQSSFKQTVVHGYRGWLKSVRPLMNLMAPVIGVKKLPRVGDPIEHAYLSFFAVRNDDPRIARSLLRAAARRASGMGKLYLFAGFAENDPLIAVALKLRHLSYYSSMYAFSFDRPVSRSAFDRSRVPYVEIAAL